MDHEKPIQEGSSFQSEIALLKKKTQLSESQIEFIKEIN